jgi:hypothetical protein
MSLGLIGSTTRITASSRSRRRDASSFPDIFNTNGGMSCFLQASIFKFVTTAPS